jgi:hypothetical protein
MKSPYKVLNEKLEKDIHELKSKIQFQKYLIEYAAGGMGVDGGGIDPAYNANLSAGAQNKGYVTGLAGGNSDAIIANPVVVAQNVQKWSQKTPGQNLGAFGFETGPQKPVLTNNIGFGMGLGYDDNQFSAARDFVNKYSKDKQPQLTSNDPNEIGYISWQTVNNAVFNRETEKIQAELQRWGLYNPAVGNIPDALGDAYNTQNVDVAFAKKLKQAEETISGKQKGKSVNSKLSKISKNKK